MSVINIKIDDNYAQVAYEKNNINHSKTMTVDSLITSLTAQYGVKVPSLMPPGTRYYMRKGNEHILFIEIPPIPRLIKYVNSSGKAIFEGIVPMPWAMLQLSCMDANDGGFRCGSGHIYALNHLLTSDKDQLYHFPAANIGGDHRICWGSTMNNMGKINSLAETGRIVDYYFSSQFNTDIHPRLNIYPRYEDLLRAIKGEKVFPLEVLARSTYNFQELVNKI